ncbi:MAG: polysaccharide biosynthesis C-terminal domain-containing protein, partial [Thiotrichaceae bacterium]|nr:polysaccharide biosynthesis C-terminal domain-containing protein [Thiotrichaceae bacterium]
MWIFFITRSAAFIAYTLIMKYQGVVKRFELPNKKLLTETLIVLPSFLVGAVLFILLSRMDFLVLSLYEQVEVIGYYAVSYRLFDITIIILSALIMALFPWVAKKFVGSKLHYSIAVKNIIMLFTDSLIIACFGGILFAEDYVSILFAKQFPHPVLLTQLFMAALLFAGMDFVASGVLHASDRQTSDVQATAVGGVVNVGLLFGLIPVYGIYGAFVAKTVATVLQCVIKFHFIRSIIGRLWSFKEVVKLMLVIAVVTAMIPLFLDAHFILKMIATIFVGIVMVPLSLLVLGLFKPLKLLRFYWRDRHAKDVDNFINLLDTIVADRRRHIREKRKYNGMRSVNNSALDRGVVAVILYRFYRYLWLQNNKVLAKLLMN